MQELKQLRKPQRCERLFSSRTARLTTFSNIISCKRSRQRACDAGSAKWSQRLMLIGSEITKWNAKSCEAGYPKY